MTTKIVMNDDTDYVHTHVINFQPTYSVLTDLVERWDADQTNGIAEYRDELQEAVERHWPEMGLVYSDLTDAVDYGVMIQWEHENP